MNLATKRLIYCAGTFAFLMAIGSFAWLKWERYLPSFSVARERFASDKAVYVQFVSLLAQDPTAKSIGSDGEVNADQSDRRFVPEYRELMHRTGAKFAIVREDGSVEFALWGPGCVICSDSYMGVRYLPLNTRARGRPGWAPQTVRSLESNELPQENGSVATGLYAVEIEPEWYIYRFEYQE